jgi:hypothetical protein
MTQLAIVSVKPQDGTLSTMCFTRAFFFFDQIGMKQVVVEDYEYTADTFTRFR